MNINKIIKNELKNLSEGADKNQENYMFFGNIKQMRRQCHLLMKEDQGRLDSILKEHDWAQDHIAEAKSLLDQVFDFLMNETTEKEAPNMVQGFNISEANHLDEGKNKPTNPKLWAASLAWARSKYKVCPSAYCNAAAAKRYKQKGGGWRKVK